MNNQNYYPDLVENLQDSNSEDEDAVDMRFPFLLKFNKNLYRMYKKDYWGMLEENYVERRVRNELWTNEHVSMLHYKTFDYK